MARKQVKREANGAMGNSSSKLNHAPASIEEAHPPSSGDTEIDLDRISDTGFRDHVIAKESASAR